MADGWLNKWLGIGGGGATVRDGSFAQEPYQPVAEPARPAPTTSSGPEIGDVVKGRQSWRLIRRLGQGAHGAVFLANPSDGSPHQDVAVKMLSLSGDQQEHARRELSSLLAVDTDRIPKVSDWRLDGDVPFVVMQYFASGSLRDALHGVGALDEPQVWRLLSDLLTALSAAHQASLLHLDIKPANVLLDDKDGYVLTDFGISQGARISADALSSWGAGTRGYQAPEQRWLDPSKFDLRTDLYGVGATAWAAWTGIHLSANQSQALLAKTQTEPYGLPKPTQFRPLGSTELEEVIMSLIAQSQGWRPGSAAEVLVRVEQAMGVRAAALRADFGTEVGPDEARAIIGNLVDPLWAHLFGNSDGKGMRRFKDGEVLAREGERAWWTYLLLRGAVRVVHDGKVLATESREGAFIGEVATLTGARRTATVIATGDCWVWPLNAAQLEGLVTGNPAVGLRLVRSMAERLART
jgi:hypothetical protein